MGIQDPSSLRDLDHRGRMVDAYLVGMKMPLSEGCSQIFGVTATAVSRMTLLSVCW
ncbi:MAG: hypothetical protein JWM11_3988 [Planctomycetaceae bacterium]|nr:hypothetical protein [Planctomycetaceae bacterium]